MTQFLAFTITGIVTGAVYAVAASGLVVTYTTSGIFNFAHGAIAMLAAFTYWQVRFAWHWPAPVALVVVIGILAPLLGAVLYLVIMRGLQDASEVTKIVVPVRYAGASRARYSTTFATSSGSPTRPRMLSRFSDSGVACLTKSSTMAV